MVLRSFILCFWVVLSTQAIATNSGQSIPLQVKRWLASGDTTQAIPWLTKASGEGNVWASFTLGKLYRLGKDVPKDPVKSLQYLTLAAQANVQQAQYLLGLQLEKDDQIAAAQYWFRSAAALGHKSATDRVAAVSRAETRNAFEVIDRGKPTASTVAGIDWQVRNAHAESPLIYAVKTGQTRWVEYLAENTTKRVLNDHDQFGDTAMHHAAQARDMALLAPLLDAGASPNAKNLRGSTPLHLAVAADDLQAAQTLLQHGADANIKDINGWSPSMLAERSKNTRLDFVSKRRSSAQRRAVTLSGDLNSQLFRAVRDGDLVNTQRLLEAGADTKFVNATGVTLLSTAIAHEHEAIVALLLRAGGPNKATSRDGQTPLAQALHRSNAQIVSQLLAGGSDAEEIDRQGHRPLHLAVVGDCVVCVDLLLQAGADATRRSNKGETPLLLAARTGHVGVAQRLVTVEAAVSISDAKSRTPLWWAVQNRLSELVRELLAHGASLEADTEGIGPLHVAVQSRDEALLAILLERSELDDVQLKSLSGSTPLLLAAYHDNSAAIHQLLERGAEIDLQNASGDTALMIAVRQDNLASARLLVQTGASLNRRNKQSDSARSLMKQMSDVGWRRLLDDAPSELGSLLERLTSR